MNTTKLLVLITISTPLYATECKRPAANQQPTLKMPAIERSVQQSYKHLEQDPSIFINAVLNAYNTTDIQEAPAPLVIKTVKGLVERQRKQRTTNPTTRLYLHQALRTAAQNNHQDLAQLLLQAGANPEKTGPDGNTALTLAATNGAMHKILITKIAKPITAERVTAKKEKLLQQLQQSSAWGKNLEPKKAAA